jgi:hypothetical protein
MFEEKFIELIEKREKADKLFNAYAKMQKKSQDANEEFESLSSSLNKLMCESGVEAVQIPYKGKDFLFTRNHGGTNINIINVCSPKEADKLAAINKMQRENKNKDASENVFLTQQKSMFAELSGLLKDVSAVMDRQTKYEKKKGNTQQLPF